MKRKAHIEADAFEAYRKQCGPEDGALLDGFFRQLARHTALTDAENRLLRQDFERALLFYHRQGVPLQAALDRLAIENLGGFYVRPPVLWYTPDDAAKIYPLSMRRGQMAVFRLSVYLKAPVVPELLQMALHFTIKRFPSFATTVKKGFFWHYMDASKRRYALTPETDIPCRPLQIARSGSPSFRVLWYNNRISVEFFHILTDGTGGTAFLKTLTIEYLRLLGHPAPPDGSFLVPNDLPSAQETENAFARANPTGKRSGFVDQPAVQLGGKLTRSRPAAVVHFKLDAAALKSAAKKKNVTVTAYVLGLLFLAGRQATDELDGAFNIQVPVNMRKFYPSATVRNFAMYCGIRLPIQTVTTLDAILPEIARQLEEKASKAAMGAMMNATQQLVRLIRYIPLGIKAPLARLIYGFLGDKIFSNTLSNLGVVAFPPALSPLIDSMDFVLGTALTNRVSCAMVTVNQVATLSVTKNTADPSFEEALYALLTADGLQPQMEGSPCDAN